MKFGVQHSIGDPAWTPAILSTDAVVRWARAAEAGGFDAIGFTDHPAPSAPWIDSGGEGVADPISGLAFCAAVTTRVRLVTFVVVPPYRNPFLLAHQLATIDALSDGRVTVGLGTGYLFGEFRALGADPGSRLQAFDESIEMMRRAWAGEEVSVETSEFVARGTRVLPPVVQRPHPPLWIHGNSRFGIERTARYGAGWLGMMTGHGERLARTTRTVPLPDFDALKKRIDDVRAAVTAAGRDPAEVEIVVAGPWPMLDVRKGRSVDQYVEDVATLESFGVDWAMSLCCGDDPGVAQETVEHFGEEIIGAVNAK
jgi:probable F420-dependent oxidoreductase